jgi:hypothetical protein
MDKKSVFHAGAVWLEALSDFENELHEHVEQAKKDQLRFQDGRLEKSLVRHIKARASGKDEWLVLFACYQFVTNTTRHLGYDEARRMHGEEMKARRFLSAREFCRSLPERFAVAPERLLEELHFRVRSVVSWMEAQESFSLWLVFKDLRPAWRRKKLDGRASAIQACYLSKLPQKLLTKTKRRGSVRMDAHGTLHTLWPKDSLRLLVRGPTIRQLLPQLRQAAIPMARGWTFNRENWYHSIPTAL